LTIFYELKPNLNPAQMHALALAGVTHIQPGLETLSSRLLSLMNKGNTARRNVEFLRNARMNRLELFWNFLYKIPGEVEKDYEEMIPILRCLMHLEPPQAVSPVAIHRFS